MFARVMFGRSVDAVDAMVFGEGRKKAMLVVRNAGCRAHWR